MSTFREAIYMVLDLLKLDSDDAFYTEEHVAYILDKYRAYVLKTKQDEDKTGPLADSNYQSIELSLEEYVPVECCAQFGRYLRSVEEVPDTLDCCHPRVYAPDYFTGEITFVSPERFKYVNSNKYTTNIIYATIGDDNHIYLKSCNPQAYYLQSVKLRAVFESALDMAEKIADNSEDCINYLDIDFPVEANLIPLVIDYVFKVLSQSEYRPEDDANNAHDDLEGQTVRGVNARK